MNELIEVYNLDGKLIKLEEKDKFHRDIEKEFFSKGKITRKIKTVRLILMNSKGRIYLQKRSKFKFDNPGLYDKTIGGHVSAKDAYDMTLIRECAEELGFPVAILNPN